MPPRRCRQRRAMVAGRRGRWSRFPGITYAVAYDGRRLAWLETTWELRVQTRSTGRRATIRYTVPDQEFVDHWPDAAAVAGRRRSPGLDLDTFRQRKQLPDWSPPRSVRLRDPRTASPQRRLRAGWRPATTSSGLGAASTASSSTGSLESLRRPWTRDPSTRSAAVRSRLLENGRKRTLPGAPPPALVARHGEHVAVSPADRTSHDPTKLGQTFIRPTPALEVRSATTGAVTSSVTATRPSRCADAIRHAHSGAHSDDDRVVRRRQR